MCVCVLLVFNSLYSFCVDVRLSNLWGLYIYISCLRASVSSHERHLSVANGRLLIHSQEQCVPPSVETDRHI